MDLLGYVNKKNPLNVPPSKQFLERIQYKYTYFLFIFVGMKVFADRYMKRILGGLLLIFLMACDNDRGNRNPYLLEVGFRFDLNLNLPLYSPLSNTGNAVYVGANGVGTRGVFVMNVGLEQFRAFEASCPNHAPNDCSTMQLNGQTAVCPCEDFEYSLFTGQQFSTPQDGTRYYDMLEYSTTFNGGVVIVSN